MKKLYITFLVLVLAMVMIVPVGAINPDSPQIEVSGSVDFVFDPSAFVVDRFVGEDGNKIIPENTQWAHYNKMGSSYTLLTLLYVPDGWFFYPKSIGDFRIKKSSSNEMLVSMVSSSTIVRPDCSLLDMDREGVRMPCTSRKSSDTVVTGMAMPPS
jgi:hypothetical protein